MDVQTPAPSGRGPLPAYRVRLAAGLLATDPAQALAVERLQNFWTKLRGYDPAPHAAHAGRLARLLRRRAAKVPTRHGRTGSTSWARSGAASRC